MGVTPHTVSSSLTAISGLFCFPPFIQKLELGSRFHVPNYIIPDLGQEKTERRESFYTRLFVFFKINGKNHLSSLWDVEASWKFSPLFCLLSADH